MNLVKSNPAELVKDTTQDGFTTYKKTKDAMAALKILTKLRGIGPATASLLLSVQSPEEIPFFSDELFRWTHWGAPGKGEHKWQRSIKYNVTEYKEILASVEGLRKRLGVAAVDAEKVAYVLGNENVNLDEEVKTEKDAKESVKEKGQENKKAEKKAEKAEDTAKSRMEEIQKAIKEERERDAKEEVGAKKQRDVKGEGAVEADTGKSAAKKGTKRKAQENAPAEGTRRSSRRKA